MRGYRLEALKIMNEHNIRLPGELKNSLAYYADALSEIATREALTLQHLSIFKIDFAQC